MFGYIRRWLKWGLISPRASSMVVMRELGRLAGTAVEKLKAMGYTDLHNLGGLKDARKKLNIPIKK